MNSKINRPGKCFEALCIAVLVFWAQGVSAGKLILEGMNKGDTNWYAGNLSYWGELDYIPCRLAFSGAQGNNQTFVIEFEHYNNGIPGIQNLTVFTPSANAVIIDGPTLTALPTSSSWYYTLTVNILDNQPGEIRFLARLAAGAHLNVGSSLAIHGKPSSMGALQIHKPGPGPGTPDLLVKKIGPATATPGDTITYSLSYSNQPSAPTEATGIQLSDILPSELTVNPNSLPAGGVLVGNTLYWDLPTLPVGIGGTITFQAQVKPSTPFGISFTNFSQILSAEDDADYSDNTSTWVTSIASCSPPAATISPGNVGKCLGDSVTFTALVSGTEPLSYQWQHNGIDISGATSNSLTLSGISESDRGVYDLVVTNRCGRFSTASTTGSVTLTLNTNVSATSITNLILCPGERAVFATAASGTPPYAFAWYKDDLMLPGQTDASLTLPSVTPADAGFYSVVVSGVCGSAVTNTASLVVLSPIQAPALSSLVKCPGETAVFGNALPLLERASFSWFKNGVLMPGSADVSLTLSSISAADAGTYSLVISGSCNTVTNSATLTVNESVVVASAPISLTNCPGTTASFSVNATGTGLSYQWSKNGTDLVGQTSSSLILNNVTASDAGTYTITVSGTCGSPVTHSAALAVNENVVVASAPISLTNCPGTTASFSVSATGTGLSYQWSKNGAALVDQTTSSLTLNNVTASDAGTYTITVSGTCGNPVTHSATLTVNENVVVASAPVSLTNCSATTVNFSVNATGTGLSYQWFKNGAALVDQTSSSLTLNNVNASDAATYTITVSGTCGNPVTHSATLTVNENIVVASAPVSLTNCPGTTASFSVSATGTGLSYQWIKDGTALVGRTGSTLVLNSVTSANAGTYAVVVSGTCGNSVTNFATLAVNQNVVVANAPVSLTNCPGTTASFSVNATGTGLSYQWSKNGTDLVNQTTSSLTLNNVTAADAGTYTITVTGTCGNPVTRSATLTVNENLVVTVVPPNYLTNCPGASAIFTVQASGTGFNYQWLKSGALLWGKSNDTLVIPAVGSLDAGAYTVVVEGLCGQPATNLPPCGERECRGGQRTGQPDQLPWY